MYLCSNLTLINITNIQFLINTDICNVTNIALVTLVHTAMEHEAARNVIRSFTDHNQTNFLAAKAQLNTCTFSMSVCLSQNWISPCLHPFTCNVSPVCIPPLHTHCNARNVPSVCIPLIFKLIWNIFFIRETWGRPELGTSLTKLVFLLGESRFWILINLK